MRPPNPQKFASLHLHLDKQRAVCIVHTLPNACHYTTVAPKYERPNKLRLVL